MEAMEDKITTFFREYAIELKEVLIQDEKKPLDTRQYNYPPENAEKIAKRMEETFRRNPYEINYEGKGFAKTCKKFNIKHTRKAIIDFLS
jgi:hypothetical protein